MKLQDPYAVDSSGLPDWSFIQPQRAYVANAMLDTVRILG